jgi:hypothetical protein
MHHCKLTRNATSANTKKLGQVLNAHWHLNFCVSYPVAPAASCIWQIHIYACNQKSALASQPAIPPHRTLTRSMLLHISESAAIAAAAPSTTTPITYRRMDFEHVEQQQHFLLVCHRPPFSPVVARSLSAAISSPPIGRRSRRLRRRYLRRRLRRVESSSKTGSPARVVQRAHQTLSRSLHPTEMKIPIANCMALEVVERRAGELQKRVDSEI